MSQTFKREASWLFGVKQDVPNFGYKDPKTGTYSGIETDLAKMVADELKVKVRYVPVTAQTRGPLLDMNKSIWISRPLPSQTNAKTLQLYQSLLHRRIWLFGQ